MFIQLVTYICSIFNISDVPREALNKSIPLMVRQAHHERNQTLTVRPEPVEGFNQRFPRQFAPNVEWKAFVSGFFFHDEQLCFTIAFGHSTNNRVSSLRKRCPIRSCSYSFRTRGYSRLVF
jgi:hypothetical protein